MLKWLLAIADPGRGVRAGLQPAAAAPGHLPGDLHFDLSAAIHIPPDQHLVAVTGGLLIRWL